MKRDLKVSYKRVDFPWISRNVLSYQSEVLVLKRQVFASLSRDFSQDNVTADSLLVGSSSQLESRFVRLIISQGQLNNRD